MKKHEDEPTKKKTAVKEVEPVRKATHTERHARTADPAKKAKEEEPPGPRFYRAVNEVTVDGKTVDTSQVYTEAAMRELVGTHFEAFTSGDNAPIVETDDTGKPC